VLRPSPIANRAPKRLTLRPFAALALLLITLLGMWLGASSSRPGMAVAADDPAAERVLARFHTTEQNAIDRFRWSQPLAAIFLYGFQGEPVALHMRLASPRPLEAAPAVLSLNAAEHPIGAFPVAPAWRRYQVLVPTSPGGETAVRLTSPAFTPADDPRELGVVLSDFSATPLKPAPGFRLPVRTVFLATLPLIGWLLLVRLGVSAGPAFATGLILAGGATWAAANPTESGYWLPTMGWPWWPGLPLILLALWPALGVGLHQIRRHIGERTAVGWVGLVLAFAALIGTRLGLWPLLGMALLVVGVWLALTILTNDHTRELTEATPTTSRTIVTALALIVGVALLLRLVNLDGQPAGLWRDESRHGLQALQIWEDPTYRPIYVVVGADLPALLFYLMAPVVGLLGPEVWSVRLVSAVIGALTPLALYWAVSPLIGRRAALYAAALLAVASWSLSMSRWAFPATLDHFLVLGAIGFLWRGITELRSTTDHRRPTTDERPPTTNHRGMVEAFANMQSVAYRIIRVAKASALRMSSVVAHPSPAVRHPSSVVRRPSFVVGLVYLGLSGLLGGLATYAYHTGRMAPIALAVVALIALGRDWVAWRRALPGLILAAVVGLLTMAPLLFYIARDLDGYNRRVGNVGVFDSDDLSTQKPLGLLLRNVQRYALMWHVAGERNGRHHMPDAPMLDPATGLLLAVGVGLALPAARRRPAIAALLALWAVYFVPGIFSGSAPHAMRSLGTLAPACALAGLGLAALLRGQGGRGEGQKTMVIGRRSFVLRPSTFILLFSLLFNAWLYFGVMASEPRVYGEFDLQETAAARIVRSGATDGVAVYLPPAMAASDTVRFLTHQTPPPVFEAQTRLPDGPALIILPVEASEAERNAALSALGPTGRALAHAPETPSGAPLLVVFGRGITELSEVRTQPIIRYVKFLRDQLGSADDRHKIRIAAPARHDVHMQVFGDAGAGDVAEVHAQIMAMRLVFLVQHSNTTLG
jgi:4-amino-4-deoxy-L-arabinose transferase-like glycosyltransferase